MDVLDRIFRPREIDYFYWIIYGNFQRFIVLIQIVDDYFFWFLVVHCKVGRFEKINDIVHMKLKFNCMIGTYCCYGLRKIFDRFVVSVLSIFNVLYTGVKGPSGLSKFL